MKENRQFLLKRLHSLTGLAAGFFLIEHLYTNQHARASLGGARAFDEVILSFQTWPLFNLIEVMMVLAPFLFHTVYGIVILFRGSVNVTKYHYVRNWNYFLQRITAIGVLLFILLHIGTTRFVHYWIEGVADLANKEHSVYTSTLIPNNAEHLEFLGAMGDNYRDEHGNPIGEHVSFETMQMMFKDIPILMYLYALGIICACFHFANGLSTMAISFGVTVSRRSQQLWGWACLGIGIALAVLGLSALVSFRTPELNTDNPAVGANQALVVDSIN
ncbi:MAG: hypothetical protein NUW37_13960 [Planctomycetes bacterium]|nr:hypothetical protein [Planctomycetota bacterium]